MGRNFLRGSGGDGDKFVPMQQSTVDVIIARNLAVNICFCYIVIRNEQRLGMFAKSFSLKFN